MAPAVSVTCRAGAPWRAAQAALYAASAGVLGAWAAGTFEWGIAGAWAAVASALGGATLGWGLSARSSVRVSWTGAHWSVATGGRDAVATSPPLVMLDLGAWMLFRTRPAQGGRAVWFDVGRVDAGPQWHLFRAAVYSSASGLAPRSSEERPPF